MQPAGGDCSVTTDPQSPALKPREFQQKQEAVDRVLLHLKPTQSPSKLSRLPDSGDAGLSIGVRPAVSI